MWKKKKKSMDDIGNKDRLRRAFDRKKKKETFNKVTQISTDSKNILKKYDKLK